MRKDLSVRGKGCNCCGGNGIPQLLSDATGVDWIREEVSRSLRQTKNEEQCLNNIGIVPSSLSGEKKGVFVSYNLHADRDGIYMGYYMEENLAGHCYRREMFRSRGELFVRDSLLSGGSCCCNCGGLEQEEKSDGTLLYAIGFTGEYSSHGRIYEVCVHRTGTFRH